MVKFVSYLKLNFNNQLNLSVITFSANLFPNEGIHAPSRLVKWGHALHMTQRYDPWGSLMFLCVEWLAILRLHLWLVLCCQFVPLETRGKLGWVNFRKDFWDCYYGQGKNWLKPRANGRNIVGQQLPTLLRQQCWELLRPFARSLMLTGASLVKIPETIMGFPDRFSFVKWRIAHF